MTTPTDRDNPFRIKLNVKEAEIFFVGLFVEVRLIEVSIKGLLLTHEVHSNNVSGGFILGGLQLGPQFAERWEHHRGRYIPEEEYFQAIFQDITTIKNRTSQHYRSTERLTEYSMGHP